MACDDVLGEEYWKVLLEDNEIFEGVKKGVFKV
jgi:hypothetical protein